MLGTVKQVHKRDSVFCSEQWVDVWRNHFIDHCPKGITYVFHAFTPFGLSEVMQYSKD